MDDLISRQAAIDALHNEIVRRRIDEDTNDDGALDEFDTEAILRRLPSEQPMRMKGKWIDKSGGIEGAWNYCSVCGEQAIDLYDFCPNCGADMRGEQNGKNS